MKNKLYNFYYSEEMEKILKNNLKEITLGNGKSKTIEHIQSNVLIENSWYVYTMITENNNKPSTKFNDLVYIGSAELSKDTMDGNIPAIRKIIEKENINTAMFNN